MALTRKQRQVLKCISDFITEHEYSPSYDELAELLNLASISTVHKHLSALKSKGYLQDSFNRHRSLEILPKFYEELRNNQETQDNAPSVPLLGTIAAGQPVETYEDLEDLSFSPLLASKDIFALRVSGQSMIDDHIMDGDYVLVQKTQQARNGEIVIALVEGAETTLKRFYLEHDKVRLQPANSEMDPIIVPAEQVQIQGRLLAVHRRY